MRNSTAEASDDYSTTALVRRLLVDEALTFWPRYTVAFLLMGVAAAGTALSAYLLGTMTNQAYVERNFHNILIIGLLAIVIFAAKGVATYGATVMLSRIGNRIVADNQRRMFDKLLARRHGFLRQPSFVGIHRVAHHRCQRGKPGHQSPLTAIGRDLLSVIGLTIVMVTQDPVMSLVGFVVAPPAFLVLRKLVDACAASREPSSPAARALSRRCRKRCRACAWSRRSARGRDAACGFAPASTASSGIPTRWRAFRPAPAR